MTPDFKNQNFKRAMDDYISVDARIAMARRKYGERLSIICNTPTFITDKEGNHVAGLFHCAILLDNRVIATGNASTVDLAEEKSIEAAESAAVGRALKHAGFAAREEFLLDDDEPIEETTQPVKQHPLSPPVAQQQQQQQEGITKTIPCAEEAKPQTKTEELKNKFFKGNTGFGSKTKVTLNDLRRE